MTDRWTEPLAHEVGRIVFAFASDDDRREVIRELADRVENVVKERDAAKKILRLSRQVMHGLVAQMEQSPEVARVWQVIGEIDKIMEEL
jgi:hypothetical protein